jgi:hypothetical protein
MTLTYESIHADMGEAFAAASDRAAPFTMTSRERMYALWQATQHIARGEILGDMIIDDSGHWQNAREATDEFFEAQVFCSC